MRRLLIVTLFLCSASSASAMLVKLTDPTSPGGANNVTRDTDTGLEWLDWTASTNISYSTMITMFDLGDTYEGWRHATSDEVRGLFEGFVLPTSAWPSVSFVVGDGAALSFFEHLGATSPTITEAIVEGEVSVCGTPRCVVKAEADSGFSVTSGDVAVSDGFPQVAVGHALVRSPSAIPEPSALLFFGLGAILTAIRRERI